MKKLMWCFFLSPILVFADTLVTTHYEDGFFNSFVDLVDTDTNTLLASLPIQGRGGTSIATTRGANGHGMAYVVLRNTGTPPYSYGLQNVTVIDTTLQEIVAVITQNMPAFPNSIVLLPNGKKAYIGSIGSVGAVTSIDTATNQVLSTLVSVPNTNFYELFLTPDGTRLFAVSQSTNRVYVFDTATDMQVPNSPITVGTNPTTAAITPDGKTFFVGNAGSSTISVIDTKTLAVQTISSVTINPNAIFSAAVSVDGQYLYMAGTTNHAYVIPTTTLIPNQITLPYAGDGQFLATLNGYVYLLLEPNGQGGQGYYAVFQNGNYLQTYAAGIGDTFGCVTTNGSVYLSDYGPPTALTFIPPNNPSAGTQVLTNAFSPGLNWIAAAPPSANVLATAQNIEFLTQQELCSKVSWNAPAGVSVSEYRIYRDAAWTQRIASLGPTSFSYLDRDLTENTLYNYYVTYISNGVESILGYCSVTNDL